LLLEQHHQKVPRGEATTERELRFSILSLSLFSKKKIKKEKIERKRESASVVVSLLRERVTFRALISSGGGKDGGRFVSDCLSEFSSCFSLQVLFRVYNPNFLLSISFRENLFPVLRQKPLSR
tara:strand:+ start:7462 stop:7830 length:369 start_codon:yes stop_codon:yes gene_type:complete